MNMSELEINVVGKNAILHCMEGTDDWIIDSLDSYTQFNSGMDNLLGSDCNTANILFVYQDKLEKLKEILNKMVLLQPEDIADDENTENIFYYLEFPCKDSPYSIIIYDEDVINDNTSDYENDYPIITQCMEEASELSDCMIYAGAAYNDYYLFHIVAYHLLPNLKHIDCSDIENSTEIESIFAEVNSQADYMSVNKENATFDDSVYFYKLIMDNLFIDNIMQNKAQGRNVNWELYTYEKVNRYLKQ